MVPQHAVHVSCADAVADRDAGRVAGVGDGVCGDDDDGRRCKAGVLGTGGGGAGGVSTRGLIGFCGAARVEWGGVMRVGHANRYRKCTTTF